MKTASIIGISCQVSAYLAGQPDPGIDSHCSHPAEVMILLDDATKAGSTLGWKPRTSSLELVAEAMAADLVLAKRDVFVGEGGFFAPSIHE